MKYDFNPGMSFPILRDWLKWLKPLFERKLIHCVKDPNANEGLV